MMKLNLTNEINKKDIEKQFKIVAKQQQREFQKIVDDYRKFVNDYVKALERDTKRFIVEEVKKEIDKQKKRD